MNIIQIYNPLKKCSEITLETNDMTELLMYFQQFSYQVAANQRKQCSHVSKVTGVRLKENFILK